MNIVLLLKIIQESIKKVHAVKYALGIAGIVAVIALIKAMGIDKRIAILGSIIMILLMVILLVFSKLTKTRNRYFHYPSIVLLYTSVILFVGAALLLFTSMFFSIPLNFNNLSDNDNNVQVRRTMAFISGRVVDIQSNQSLAAVKIDVNGKRYLSDTRGNFNIDIADSTLSKGVNVVFEQQGYVSQQLNIKETKTDLRIQLIKKNND